MDKKELIFPGTILGIVLIAAIGLILTQGGQKPALSTPDTATTTASSTVATSSDVTSGGTSEGTGSTGTGSSGSVTPAPKYYYPYGSLTLAVNQAAGFRNGASIRPLQVLEDSRCPAEVQCIQAGTVKLSLKAKAGETTKTFTPSIGDTISFDGLSITFKSVAPLKTKAGMPAASAYRFTFVVEPAGSASGSISAGPCYVGGCSNEICSDTQGQVSSCIYRAAYACYRGARCERQANGACGWTQTPELTRCLVNAQGV